MKTNLSKTIIFVILILGLAIFGCAEKKSVVTTVNSQEQEIAPAPTETKTTDTLNLNDTTTNTANLANPSSTTNTNDTASREQSTRMESTTTAEGPVRDINFDFDSSVIRPDAREILQANATYLLRKRVSAIVIEGHCDEQGTAEYNMALGQRRAEETKQYLANLGIKESIMKTISYGEERPLDQDSSEDSWSKNRRAHFVVTP